MNFTYKSTKGPFENILPVEVVKELKHYLADLGFGMTWNHGKLQDALLDFRDHKGDRLMINHLEPVFVYLSREGQLWPEE